MHKILLHGATNWGSSNFGDYIYVDAAIRHIKSIAPESEIRIAEPSDYFLAHLPGFVQADFRESDADLVVYVPGGYFGEGHAYRFRDALIHFVRFMPVGIRAILRKQRICVVGIGAGPISNPLLKWGVKRICDYACSVSVRDRESLLALEGIGVKNVSLAFDPIVALPIRSWKKPLSQSFASRLDSNKRVLLVHYNHSKMAMEYFAHAVKSYMSTRSNTVSVVVMSDQLLDSEEELFSQFCELSGVDALRFRYDDPYEAISVIDSASCVLTCKLHVGVVATMLGSSVICAAEHPEKSKRFYKYIGCPERCFSLYETSSQGIADAMEKMFIIPMQPISPADIELASAAWDGVDLCLRS